MAEYREKGEVEKPILSDEELKERSLSEASIEGIEIKDEDGSEELNVRRLMATVSVCVYQCMYAIIGFLARCSE